MRNIVLLFVALITLTGKIYGVVRYITPSGAGALDGTSWANALPGTSIQAAITASGVGDEIWIATGLYRTTLGVNRAISFSMKNDVALYGSFAGTETSVSQRVLTSGLTSSLSGEIGIPGIADNSYHTISNSNLNNTAILDGFIIRDANDDRAASLTNGLGGGIYNNGSGAGNTCSPTIRNCVIINNQAAFGAGIFNSGYNGGVANPVISHCVIANNTATIGGGGVDNFGLLNGNASPIITNCVIYNNSAAQRAGAMYCWGGNNGNASPSVINTVFVNNSAIDGGGVVSDRLNSGAGSSGNSNPVFKNCIFWGNTASGTGPQFFILGGATFSATYSDIDLTGQGVPHVISGAGTGNINVNPSFLSIGSGTGADAIWMTSDDGLQLSANTSPCYNSGDNIGVSAGDILNNNRIAFATVDMGAYEFSSTPLPITLTSFFADLTFNNQVNLNWTTESELNNKGFEIYRSENAIDFNPIGFIDGAKNSSDIAYYNYVDENPFSGYSFYRLKQIDFDGKFEYSKIVTVHVSGSDPIGLYPNPINNQLIISRIKENLDYQIINANGQTLQRGIAIPNKSILITDLPNGFYYILINHQSLKFIKE